MELVSTYNMQSNDSPKCQTVPMPVSKIPSIPSTSPSFTPFPSFLPLSEKCVLYFLTKQRCRDVLNSAKPRSLLQKSKSMNDLHSEVKIPTLLIRKLSNREAKTLVLSLWVATLLDLYSRYPAYQILTLLLITIAKLKL